MFSVGEFSKLAQVSKRQLRFYDQISLFTPQCVQDNGRRVYSAHQLADLHRILALQQLGFSLEQIRKLTQEDISVQELRAMLKLKQAESEQRLAEEQQRYKAIASRLRQLDDTDSQRPLNVVVKSVPTQMVLSRKLRASLEVGTGMFRELVRGFTEEPGVRYGPFFIELFGLDYNPEQLEGQIGRIIESGQPSPQMLELTLTELPAAHVVSYVIEGAPYDLHLAYGAIAMWIERHGYRLAGGSRELLAKPPQANDTTVIEVQAPITKQDLS